MNGGTAIANATRPKIMPVMERYVSTVKCMAMPRMAPKLEHRPVRATLNLRGNHSDKHGPFHWSRLRADPISPCMNQTDRVKTRILPENDSPGENLRARRAPRSLKMDQNRPKFKGDRSIERVSSRVKIRWFFQAKIRCKTDCSLSV